jgi:hypothetical protein
MKCIFRCVVSNAALACLMLFAEIAPAAILPTPISSSASSEFGGPYVAGALFDGTVADADLGVTVYGVSDNQWAGVGPGPHNLFMDYGATISASGLAYAQRAGAFGGNNDKVGKIELWFSNSDFGSVLPATPAQATVNPSVPSPNSGVLLSYPLGSLLTGRYVAARFTALDTTLPPNVNNIGGSELRLTIPEPTAISMLVLVGSVALVVVRSKRGTH